MNHKYIQLGKLMFLLLCPKHDNVFLSHTPILFLEPKDFSDVLVFADHFSVATYLITFPIVNFLSSTSTVNNISVKTL